MKNTFRFISLLFAFLISYNLVSASAKFDEGEVKNRVKARWETIMKHEFGGAYEFEAPTYKAVFTKDLYVNQFSYGVSWNLTKIDEIKYDSSTGVVEVVVDVETKPRNSKELDTKVKTASVKIREKWLHIEGRWWHSSSE